LADSSFRGRCVSALLLFGLILFQTAPIFGFTVFEGKKLEVDTNLIMGMDYRYEMDYFPGRSGFRITDARVDTRAVYQENLIFTLKFDIADISTDKVEILKTVTMQYCFIDPFRLKAGYGKIPFGEEYSRGVVSRPNIYHSEASDLMVPGRSVGLTFSGKNLPGNIGYKTGFYNGTTNSWEKNESALHIATANIFFKNDFNNNTIKSGYNILYSMDESFGHGVYVDFNHEFKKNLALNLFSEYMEQRYYNYHWNHSVFTVLSMRIKNVEPLLYFDYYNDNVGYDGKEDKMIPGLGFNSYFIKDKIQLKTDIRTEYLNSYPTGYNSKFYNTKLTVKLILEL
jgi:hypothetical protein